jgi:hypothetical protein
VKRSQRDAAAAVGDPPPSPLYLAVTGTPAPKGSMTKIPPQTLDDGRVIPARMVADNDKILRPWNRALDRQLPAQLPHRWPGGDMPWCAGCGNGRMAHYPLLGPCWARGTFTFRRPKSDPKTIETYPCGDEGDVDKLVRAVLDGLVRAGILVDDRLVCDLRPPLRKRYVGQSDAAPAPGVSMEVGPL